jgi:hypothetical protein
MKRGPCPLKLVEPWRYWSRQHLECTKLGQDCVLNAVVWRLLLVNYACYIILHVHIQGEEKQSLSLRQSILQNLDSSLALHDTESSFNRGKALVLRLDLHVV